MSMRIHSFLLLFTHFSFILPLAAQITPPGDLHGVFLDGKVILSWNKPESHIEAMVFQLWSAWHKTLSAPIRRSIPLSDLSIMSAQSIGRTLQGAGHLASSCFRTMKEYELPPLPPAEAFDVCFASQPLVELHTATTEKAQSYPIAL